MTLKEAKIGSTVTVKKLTGEGAVKRRIMDMGITKGVEVQNDIGWCTTTKGVEVWNDKGSVSFLFFLGSTYEF